MQDVQNLVIRGLAGRLAGADPTMEYLISVTENDRPNNYVETRKSAISRLTTSDLQAALNDHLDIDSLAWVIAGDLAKIEQEIRSLNLGDVEVWSIDGDKLR